MLKVPIWQKSKCYDYIYYIYLFVSWNMKKSPAKKLNGVAVLFWQTSSLAKCQRNVWSKTLISYILLELVYISKRLIWQDDKRLVLKIYCISLVPLNTCITNTLILHQMIQLLIGILRYFEIYPVYDVWRKVCEKKVVIFNFRRRRGIYLESTLTIVKPSKSGQKILFKIILFETFMKLNVFYGFYEFFLVVLIWNLCCLTTANQIKYFCTIL